MLAIIGRRELIAALAATATTWPIASSAENQPERPPQPQPMPVIGVVQIEKRAARSPLDDAFSQGLMRTGYVENQNVAIEWRWTDGRYEHLQGILAELVDRHVVAIAV